MQSLPLVRAAARPPSVVAVAESLAALEEEANSALLVVGEAVELRRELFTIKALLTPASTPGSTWRRKIRSWLISLARSTLPTSKWCAFISIFSIFFFLRSPLRFVAPVTFMSVTRCELTRT
jgi:hypothetical protein